jgi:putative transposase
MLQDLGRRYVRVINTLHGRTGTLWEGRFKSSLVDTETYFLTCHRYIEYNPVRAGLVSHPAAYPWSSHDHYASGISDRLITEHRIFTALASSPPERHAMFRSLFSEDLDLPTSRRIRHAANTGCALGSDEFFAKAEARLGRSVRPPKRGRPTTEESAAFSVDSGKLL